jgi:hypothetical protein
MPRRDGNVRHARLSRGERRQRRARLAHTPPPGGTPRPANPPPSRTQR